MTGGDALGRTYQRVGSPWYAVCVGEGNAAARLSDTPYGTEAGAVKYGRLHARPGEAIVVWKVDPDAPEDSEWTRVFSARAAP